MIRPISFTVFVITALSSVADPVVLQSPPAIRVAESQVLAVRPGDFDRDGRPDVLVAHYRDQIEVLLSRGAGTYERVSTLVPDLDALPTVAEITGDGTLDFAYWPAGSVSTIVVYAGDGSGAFKPWSRLDTLREPEAVAVADFDRDGNADFIVSGEDAGSNYQTAIHFGRATGTFGAAATVTSHRPSELVATDLTNDAIVDVVDTGGVLIGRGDGTFERRWMYEMRMITVGDFNRDGWKDLASLGHDPYVSVALGTGGGHFAPRVKYLVGDVLAMALADVDEDGIEDIVTSGGYLAVLRGIGDGRFAPAERYVSPRGKEIVCGDFDWDGDVDAITDSSFFSYIPGLSFLAGTGAGSFDAYRSFLVHIDPSASQIGLASGPVADMNGDGYPDVIFLFGRYEPAGYLWDLIVMLNDGTGKLTTQVATRMGAFDKPVMAVGDTNGDGRQDVVVASELLGQTSHATFLGRGDGTFSAAPAWNISLGGSFALADFNGDGKLDLHKSGPDSSVGKIFRGLGDGTFGSPMNDSVPRTLIAGDLNGDGAVDLVSLSGSRVLLNDGAGSFVTKEVKHDGSSLVLEAIGDFNGDRRRDLLFTTSVGTRMFFGRGDGTFLQPVDFIMSPIKDQRSSYDSHLAPTADFDGDGFLDVVFGNVTYLGDGTGRFRALLDVRARSNASAAADMDSDGGPDVVLIDGLLVSVLKVDRTTQSSKPSSTTLVADQTLASYATRVTLTAKTVGEMLPAEGAVLFRSNGVPVALITRNRGEASVKYEVPTGMLNVEAIYVASGYVPSTGSVQIEVTKAPTSLTVKSPAYEKESVRVVVWPMIQGFRISLPGPSGQVVFREAGAVIPMESHPNGSYSTTRLAQGRHTIVAEYPGDKNYLPSQYTFEILITQPEARLVLTMTPGAGILAGMPVTVRAVFPDHPDVAGSVDFYTESGRISTVPVVNASAELLITFTAGVHEVFAFHNGDAKYARGTSAEVRVFIVYNGLPRRRTTGRSN